MIVAGSANPLLLGQSQGYNLTKSLRFRSSASAYLNRTPASATNQKTWTLSMWMKRGSSIGTSFSNIFSARTGASGTYTIAQFASDVIQFVDNGGMALYTTQVFRDPSAWYHFVFAVDTTQSTASNRVKLYVNGSQITSFSTATYPSLNADLNVNSTATQLFGQNASSQYADYYLAEINFIDGQQLTPSSFGQTSSTTGVWQPIKYTGTYGTNGFYLPFTNTSSTSTLGNDFSGNNNTWTVNNISLTSGATYDSMTDVPTNTDTNTANYAVWNPLAVGTNITTSNGNLQAAASSNSNAMLQGTFGITSGKWYWEVTLSSGTSAWAGSIIKSTAGLNYSSLSSGDAYSYSNDGSKYNGQTSTSYGNTYTTNDVISVAYNADTGKIWYAKNGTWQASGDPAAGTNEAYSGISGTYMPAALLNSATGIANFGQRPFAYTPPTGFVALNTFNLPTPTIGATASTVANKYMDATLYTGTGASLSVTNANSFQPDMVWIKCRSNARDNKLTDSVRGTTKGLISNTTGAETTDTNGLTAFNSNGFTIGSDAVYNTSTNTYVAWQWRASNASGVTNTAGSITSTVSANTTAGFSIVTYTGTGANATVGHGLGVAPKMIIWKQRTGTNSSVNNWIVWQTALSATQYLSLNATDAVGTSTSVMNSTLPTSSVFSLGTSGSVNVSSGTYVAYCFAEVAGYSAFGSYTGNASSDGPFVFTGFRPRFILFKNASSAGTVWIIFDTARNTYNFVDAQLRPNESSAENSAGSFYSFDILSNGFKVRSSDSNFNGSGNTMIYAAFAESPFKYANAR